MKKKLCAIGGLSIAVFIEGCAIGYNSALFVTKTNVGIDMDTQPPAAEISIARREFVLAPGFEGGQTPPLVASFQSNSGGLKRFMFGVQSVFAGGDAAIGVVRDPAASAVADGSSVLCLSIEPSAANATISKKAAIAKAGEIRPFVFGTDTTFGLKFTWSGVDTAAVIPDSVKLGFNRKEFAIAPISGTSTASCNIPGVAPAGSGKYMVSIPSFLALLDNNVDTDNTARYSEHLNWKQYIATGASATTLSNQSEVRAELANSVKPTTVELTSASTADVGCVQAWLAGDASRQKELQAWWQEKQLPGFAASGIRSTQFASERAAFIKDKTITCP